MNVAGLLAYLAAFCIMGSIYALLCLGLNVQWGYTGLFNIGVAGFFLVGAYTSALVTTSPPDAAYAQYVTQAVAVGLPFPVGLVAAALVSGLLALLVGLPTLRLGHDYLAIATLGIAESIRMVFENEGWLANGTRGLIGIPQPLTGLLEPRDYNYIYLVITLAILLTTALVVRRSLRTPWGRVLRAIRDDPLAAATAGKNVFGYRLQSMVVRAMVMGIGGALYAHYTKAITPEVFTPLYGTFIVWAMVMVGGSGNLRGSLVGAFAVWGVWVLTQSVTDALLPVGFNARAPFIRFILIGVALLVMLIRRPQGIVGEDRDVSVFIGRAPGTGRHPPVPTRTPPE